MESGGMGINGLPIEIIIKILRHLSNNNLRKAILACKLWKSIIESSCPMWLVINCEKLNDEENQRIKFLTTTDRRFRRLVLRGELLISDAEKVIEIVRHCGFDIVELGLVNVRFDELLTFIQILNCLPNLTELIAFKTSTLHEQITSSAENELPDLIKLETLQIDASQYSILKCLKKAKVKTLKVVNSDLTYRRDALEDFLKTQNGLTALALQFVYNTSHWMLFHTMNPNDPMPFQLTRLSLLHVLLADSDYKNMLMFMEKHSKTLKELDLGRHLHHTIYECVFAKMTNLETLHLRMDTIRIKTEHLETNLSIKNLIIKQAPRIVNLCHFSDFLKCLPNVTTIAVVTKCSNELWKVIAESLTELRVVQVKELYLEFYGVQFPNRVKIQLIDRKYQ